MDRGRIVLSHSAEETYNIGKVLGATLSDDALICFFGEMGAGKTTFIKGLVAGANGYSSSLVNSPTFVYLNIYPGSRLIYHFDLYRLQDVNTFLTMGFDEYFFSGHIICMEWSERILPILPAHIQITLQEKGENIREISILYPQESR